MLVLDGNAGFGQTICMQAVTLGIERALERGVALSAYATPVMSDASALGPSSLPRSGLFHFNSSIRLDRAASRSRPRERVNVELPQTRSPLAFPRRVAPRFCLT